MIKRGQVYQKQTESWCGNDPKGTRVKVVSVEGNFVKHKKLGRFFGFYVAVGSVYILNTWSFRRIFIDCAEQLLTFDEKQSTISSDF